jgi:antitoxin (DNA-binding transcriptional repressor) of toxin-antitoxin stability system
MSETPKHMKSNQIRQDWKAVLDAVQNGEEIVVEHYNRPIARIIPYEEPAMNRYFVEQYNDITETTSREIDGYASPVAARMRADAQNSKHGSVTRGSRYYVVEVDEDGNDVQPAPANDSTGDPELDRLIMGDRPQDDYSL